MSETTNPTNPTTTAKTVTIYTVGCDTRALPTVNPPSPSIQHGVTIFEPVAWQPTEEEAVRAVETHYRKLDPSPCELTLDVLANADRTLLCVDVRSGKGEGTFAVLASYRVARVAVEVPADAAGVDGGPVFGIVEPPKPKSPTRAVELSPRAETIQFLKAQGNEVRI